MRFEVHMWRRRYCSDGLDALCVEQSQVPRHLAVHVQGISTIKCSAQMVVRPVPLSFRSGTGTLNVTGNLEQ